MKRKFKLLAAQLQNCPSPEPLVDKKMVVSVWQSLRKIDLENGYTVTPALIVGVILHDQELLHPLLTTEELKQLETIAKNALERYHQSINPPKPVGQALAAALKGTE